VQIKTLSAAFSPSTLHTSRVSAADNSINVCWKWKRIEDALHVIGVEPSERKLPNRRRLTEGLDSSGYNVAWYSCAHIALRELFAIVDVPHPCRFYEWPPHGMHQVMFDQLMPKTI